MVWFRKNETSAGQKPRMLQLSITFRWWQKCGWICEEEEIEQPAQTQVLDYASNSNVIATQSYDNYETSYQNVLRLLSTISNQLVDLNNKPAKESLKPHLDQLYSSLLKCVPFFTASTDCPNLASLAKVNRKRKLSESDKQLRLVANEKSKPGRKPL